MECPICHTVAVPNRVAYENVHIVYINTTDANREQRQLRSRDKAALVCCFLLFGWSIALTILELTFGRG